MNFSTPEMLVVSLVFTFTLMVILPLYKRYLRVIFLLENYLNAVLDVAGESEVFYDAALNTKSPMRVALTKGNNISLADCMHDESFLDETIRMINAATKYELNKLEKQQSNGNDK